MIGRFHVDSFSGSIADLRPKERNIESVLAVLAKDPRVSTWDMSECRWIRSLINELETRGFIVAKKSAYPWHRYSLTDQGRAFLAIPRKE